MEKLLQLIHEQITNFPYIVKISPNQNYRNNMENGLLENIVKRCRLSHKKSNVYTDTLKCQFSPLSLAEVRKFNNIFLAKTEKQAFLRITGLCVNDFKICRGQFGNICQNFQSSCILIRNPAYGNLSYRWFHTLTCTSFPDKLFRFCSSGYTCRL